MNKNGIIKLIKWTETEERIEQESPISMHVSPEGTIHFEFEIDAAMNGERLRVFIDPHRQESQELTPYGLQIIEYGSEFFVLNFCLHDDNQADDASFVCTAIFEGQLPQIGFISDLRYHFRF